MNDTYDQMLQTASVLINGGNVKEGRKILEQIVQEADGAHWAAKAMEILVATDPKEKQIKQAPKVIEFLTRLYEILGLTDPRLIPLLKELKARPTIAARIRPDVVTKLCDLSQDILPKIAEGMKAKELRAIENCLEVISTIEAYDIDEVKQLRKAIFGARFREVSQRIRAELQDWKIDQAWDEFAKLSHPPVSFQDEISTLQEEIYEAVRLRKGLEELLGQLPKTAPEKWLEIRMLVNTMQKLQAYLDNHQVPLGWRSELKQAAERGATEVEAFLKNQATKVVNLKDLQAFWAEYERLDTQALGYDLTPKPAWFETCLNYVLSIEQDRVVAAKTPEKLKAVSNDIALKGERLPPFAGDYLKSLTDEIAQMIAKWKTLQSGDDFEDFADAPPARLPIPVALHHDVQVYRTYLNEIDTAAAAIKEGEGTPTEQIYKQASQVAQAVLEQVPGHARARALERDANRGILYLQLDTALLDWQDADFFRLCQNSPADPLYNNPRLHQALNELAPLARRDALANWRDAADWWASWRIASSQLPEATPDSLKKAIDAQEMTRTDQWYNALENVQRQELMPEELRQVADSLQNERVALNLQGYYKVFVHKATVGLVRQYIGDRAFDRAAEEMRKLDPDHKDTFRLRILLQVEQAKARGVSALADVLRNQWNNVVVGLENANGTLLEAVQRAWQENDLDALTKLKEVINRVFASREPLSADLQALQEWEAWLKVEDAIRLEVSLLSVKHLISYMKEASPNSKIVHQRLERLVEHWRGEDNLKMLAWAYQAFKRVAPAIMPGSDPIIKVIEQSDRVAESVLGDLHKQADFRLDEAQSLRDALKREENEWNYLNDFLESLRPPADRQPLPGKIMAVIQQVEDLIKVLQETEQFERADFRDEAVRYQLDETRQRVRKGMSGLNAQPTLLARIERLEPLKEIGRLEEHVREAAEKCGSDAADSLGALYDLTLFPELSQAIRAVIEKFVQARAEGRALWQTLGAEYSDWVYEKAGILLPKLSPPDLRALADEVDALSREEMEFEEVFRKLKNKPVVAAGGVFDPTKPENRVYLSLFPQRPPGSSKVYRRFNRFISVEPMPTIIRQSRSYIPDWVYQCLTVGVP